MSHAEPLDHFVGTLSRVPMPQPAQLREQRQILTASE
jgi:hypothetical protein